MTAPVTVPPARPAIAADLAAIAGIWHRGWHEAHAHLVPPDLTRERTLESFIERLPALLADTWVLGPVGAPWGFCSTRDAELYQLFVDPVARGTGAAALLLANGEARLRSQGITLAWLACAIGNDRAARFYETRGWVRVGNMINEAVTARGPYPLETWRYEKPLTPTSD